MTPQPTHSATPAPAERRPAVWPWLLLPFVALLIFLLLFELKSGDDSAAGAGQTDTTAPAPDLDTH